MIWFTVGAVVAVAIVVEGQRLLRKATPAGIQEQAQETAGDLAVQARAFWTTFTRAMSEREAELRDALGIDDEATQRAAAPARRAIR